MSLRNRLYLGITGRNADDLIQKIEAIDKMEIDTAGLFLELLSKKEREKVYDALKNSAPKKFPLVHIRNGMSRDELNLLTENYGAKYLTIHETSFQYLKKWHGYFKNLFVELNFDNRLSSDVDIQRVGGFCIDIAHFKAAAEKWSKEFEYVLDRRKNEDLFKCNHLSGYSYKNNTDLHEATSLHDFDYIENIPDFILGDVVCIEVMNSISEQIGFMEYIKSLR
jgi:hypothetical protein